MLYYKQIVKQWLNKLNMPLVLFLNDSKNCVNFVIVLVIKLEIAFFFDFFSCLSFLLHKCKPWRRLNNLM